jgi:ubiquinone/menaquinone biosynthesis C-methylase UbiE
MIALKRAKSLKLHDYLIQGDYTMLPFKDESFDVVFALEILYYLEDYNICLKEIYRILKNNGYLIISVALGEDYLDWNKFKEDVCNYFKIVRSKVLKYPLWLLKRKHFGKGIIVVKKVV